MCENQNDSARRRGRARQRGRRPMKLDQTTLDFFFCRHRRCGNDAEMALTNWPTEWHRESSSRWRGEKEEKEEQEQRAAGQRDQMQLVFGELSWRHNWVGSSLAFGWASCVPNWQAAGCQHLLRHLSLIASQESMPAHCGNVPKIYGVPLRMTGQLQNWTACSLAKRARMLAKMF